MGFRFSHSRRYSFSLFNKIPFLFSRIYDLTTCNLQPTPHRCPTKQPAFQSILDLVSAITTAQLPSHPSCEYVVHSDIVPLLTSVFVDISTFKMNNQNNQKPPIVRVGEMLDGIIKEGLYRVAPELKTLRTFLEARQKAQPVALKTLYYDSGVRTPISKGAMECHITTVLWKRYYPYGQGSPVTAVMAQCEELCPEPDQRWAKYLEQRLREEGNHLPVLPTQYGQMELSASISAPPPSRNITTNTQPTAAVPTPNPMSSTKKISFRLSQKVSEGRRQR